MRVILNGSKDITKLLVSWTWEGDKAAISRQLSGEVLVDGGQDLPLPAIGDTITMEDQGREYFSGRVLIRDQHSEGHTMSWAAFDRGYYLQRNHGTFKFTGATPEQITRLACEARGLPVATLPSTGVSIRRKFSAVPLDKLITTAWTLASEQTGKAYAIRWAPAGLVVKERAVASSNLVIQTRSNLMEARTKEDASKVVNSVAIYDQNGNLVRRIGDSAAQTLCGVMEQHITQSKDGAADADKRARLMLEEGAPRQSVTVDLLGDTSLITGETVEVREPGTGLLGVFWIDSDCHSWKRGQYYTRLVLNCKNVMNKASAGGELK